MRHSPRRAVTGRLERSVGVQGLRPSSRLTRRRSTRTGVRSRLTTTLNGRRGIAGNRSLSCPHPGLPRGRKTVPPRARNRYGVDSHKGAGAKRGLTLGRIEGDLGDGQLLRSGSLTLLTPLPRPRTWPNDQPARAQPTRTAGALEPTSPAQELSEGEGGALRVRRARRLRRFRCC